MIPRSLHKLTFHSVIKMKYEPDSAVETHWFSSQAVQLSPFPPSVLHDNCGAQKVDWRESVVSGFISGSLSYRITFATLGIKNMAEPQCYPSMQGAPTTYIPPPIHMHMHTHVHVHTNSH